MSRGAERRSSVWAATWVPGRCPLEELGATEGYAVAWVDVEGAGRVQAVVSGATEGPPAIGTVGALADLETDLGPIPVFTPGGAR